MISSAILQRAYDDLYIEVRKYFWSYDAVVALAELEIATYKACPDIEEIKRALNSFKYYAHDVLLDDEDLAKTFDDFEDLLDSSDTAFKNLERVNEVISQ